MYPVAKAVAFAGSSQRDLAAARRTATPLTCGVVLPTIDNLGDFNPVPVLGGEVSEGLQRLVVEEWPTSNRFD